MNPKRQVIEQAIMDLEENIETVKQIYDEYLMKKRSTPPDQRKQFHDAMKETFYERENIANRLFHDWLRINPRSAYYDPNPTPVFYSADFHRSMRKGKPRSFPIIVASSGKRAENGAMTNINTKKFIEQLRTKLKKRKDLQENNIMKLTEAKLKQMILDEMKSNLSISDQDELNADIELVRKISAELDEIRREEDEIYASGEAERLSDYDNREQAKAERDRIIDSIAKKYGVEFYRYGQPGNKYLIDKLRKRFRRRSL